MSRSYSVHVSSLVSHRDRQPYVSLAINDTQVQLEPKEAREIAGHLLEAAEASEQDAFFMEFMERELELNERQAAQMLQKFRKHREREAGAEELQDALQRACRHPMMETRAGQQSQTYDYCPACGFRAYD